MPRYRVTLRRTTVEIVEAPNPYQAAIVASDRGGGDAEVTSVAPAVGRPSASTGPGSAAKATAKKARKKRRPLSPEARAKLAQNLVRARAARAAKHKSAKRAATKKTRAATKKTRAAKTTKAVSKKR
jgi:hypothetical protein